MIANSAAAPRPTDARRAPAAPSGRQQQLLQGWRPRRDFIELTDRKCRWCDGPHWDGVCKTAEAQQAFKLRADTNHADKGKRDKVKANKAKAKPKADPAANATKRPRDA